MADSSIEVVGAKPLGLLEVFYGLWQGVGAVRLPATRECGRPRSGATSLGLKEVRSQEEGSGQETCAGQPRGLYVQWHGD